MSEIYATSSITPEENSNHPNQPNHVLSIVSLSTQLMLIVHIAIMQVSCSFYFLETATIPFYHKTLGCSTFPGSQYDSLICRQTIVLISFKLKSVLSSSTCDKPWCWALTVKADLLSSAVRWRRRWSSRSLSAATWRGLSMTTMKMETCRPVTTLRPSRNKGDGTRAGKKNQPLLRVLVKGPYLWFGLFTSLSRTDEH